MFELSIAMSIEYGHSAFGRSVVADVACAEGIARVGCVGREATSTEAPGSTAEK